MIDRFHARKNYGTGWMGGGWKEVKAGLRIAYSNQKTINKKLYSLNPLFKPSHFKTISTYRAKRDSNV